jgi:diacylglycerol O-acyltransferase / wax synthase
MSAIDSSFLQIENDTKPMHIGGVSICQGPRPPFERVRDMVADKLDLARFSSARSSRPSSAGNP